MPRSDRRIPFANMRIALAVLPAFALGACGMSREDQIAEEMAQANAKAEEFARAEQAKQDEREAKLEARRAEQDAAIAEFYGEEESESGEESEDGNAEDAASDEAGSGEPSNAATWDDPNSSEFDNTYAVPAPPAPPAGEGQA